MTQRGKDACAIARAHVLTSLSRHEVPPLGRCALVGTGSNLAGVQLGRRIDEHDSVIRVNRLSTTTFAADVGVRTSIYFKNQLTELVASGARARVKVRHLGATVDSKRNDTKDWCDLVEGGAACAFDALVYEGALDAGQRWPSDGPLAAARFTTARQSDALLLFQSQVLGLGRAVPPFGGDERVFAVRATAGAKAFFTFALLCDSLTLFGFGGRGTIDRHGMRVKRVEAAGGKSNTVEVTLRHGHDYEAEHSFLRRVARGQLKERDLPHDMPSWWSLNVSARGAAKPQHRAIPVRSEFAHLARSLVCRARARRIRMYEGSTVL